MWLLWLMLFYVREISGNLANEVQDLTNNFFANLNADPFLRNADFSETSVDFINRQTENYLGLIKDKYGIERRNKLAKRSIDENIISDHGGTFLFEGFSPVNIPIVENASDISFVKQKNHSHAIVLEKGNRNSLIFYKQNDSKFELVFKEFVGPVNKMLTHVNILEILVIISSLNSIVIYTIVNDTLKKMQTLNSTFLTNIIMWENTNGIFLAITRENSSTVQSTCFIYKWSRKYFDLVDEIASHDTRSLSAISIGNIDFLAVANYQYDGRTETYSELFKYSIDTEKYCSHQEILTSGVVDMRFFSIERNGMQETYLIAANSFKDGKQMFKANSIIYKYVDKYFIPFQSVPVRTDKWIPITGRHGELLLVSLSKTEGVKTFLYDGWSFIENKVPYNENFKSEITNMEFDTYMDNPILKLSNKNGKDDQISLYTLKFSHENKFSSFHSDMLRWCEEALMTNDNDTVEELKNIITNGSKIDMTKEYTDDTRNDKTRTTRQFQEEENLDYDRHFEHLDFQLKDNLEEINEIKEKIDEYLMKTDLVVIEGDLVADNVTLKDEAFFKNDLLTEIINGNDPHKFLNKRINIKEDHNFTDQIIFETLKVEDAIEPKYINGEELANLLNIYEPVDLGDVTVDGKVILNNGLLVGKSVNGKSLNSETVLLREGDQVLSGDLLFKTASVRNGKSDYLNRLNLRAIPKDTTDTLSEIENLKVKNLVIGGYLNDVDVNVLNKHALRTFGDQEISKNYTFETLQVNQLVLQSHLSGKDLSRIILINGGEFDLKKDVQFSNDLVANAIRVNTGINHIKVLDHGRLDVLLKNTEEVQHVTGFKTFEDVIVLNPINLHGKINNSSLEKMNPITFIDEKEIEVKGDYVFYGKVTVEKLLESRDIKGSKSDRTLRDIVSDGVAIDNEELPCYMTFTRPLKVDKIFVDTINGRNVDDFVINGNGISQYIKGWKTFESDLHITGDTSVVNVNDIHIPSFEKNILTIDGDQEITGKHIIQNLVATSVNANTTKLGDHLWQDIVTDADKQTIHGTTVLNSSPTATYVEANFTEINGLINNYNFTEMLNDTADMDITEIDSHKTFDKLEVENLFVSNAKNIDDFAKILEDYQNAFEIEENLILLDGIRVENLTIDGHLNEMKTEDFNRNWLEKSEDQVFDEEYFFDTVTVHGNATILSNEINGVNMKDITDNTVKIDEPFFFDDVTFKTFVLSEESLTLEGHISGLDLDNVVLSSNDEQVISGIKTFAHDVAILGSLDIKGSINGLDYEQLRRFSIPNVQENLKSLIITENAYFLKGPSLKQINDRSIQNIVDNAWMTNKETTLNGHIEFETVKFQNNITVEGLVDGVNVTWLFENYFSKTKNQTILAHLDFTDGAIFLNGVSAPEVRLMGRLTGLDIMQFMRTAILYDVEQVFENTLYVQACTIDDLNGDYLVNDMNLQNDIMRYDSKNIVTGTKTVPNLVADNLVLTRNVPVQNVDVLSWIQKSVAKTGGALNGKCIFHGAVTFTKGVGVVGLVNGITFDNKNVMLKSEEQIISGKKRFYPETSSVTFVDLKLEEFVNGINMSELMENQASKSKENIFETQLNFNESLTTHNLNVKRLYNNVNVTELIIDLIDLQDLNNYYENYAHLLNVSNKIKDSLDYQAYFLDHFAVVQHFEKVSEVFYVSYQGFSCVAETNRSTVSIYKWEDSSEMFALQIGKIHLKGFENITYLSILGLENEEYLYVEYQNLENEESNVIGTFFRLNNTDRALQQYSTNGTRHIHAFVLPDKNQKCFIFTYLYDKRPNIYCESYADEWLIIHQQLETFTTSKATTFNNGLIPYIVIIHEKIENAEVYIDIWKFDENTRIFNRHQILYATAPHSISVVTYKDVSYLAVASGHLHDATYQGTIQISRFDKNAGRFLYWQNINVGAPIQVEFSILPTNELVLYVLTDNVIEPLLTYMYEGVMGFRRKHAASTLRKMSRIKKFNTIDGNHFILGENDKGMILIRAYFKGHKKE